MFEFIDGDFFESLSDFSFGDMYSSTIIQPNYQIMKSIFDQFDHPKIFIETHRLGYLLNELNNFLGQKCTIIAHNSDATFGQDLLKYIPKNVDKLWCQNYNYIETDVVKSLPIGLERVRWFPEQKKQELLYEILSKNEERENLIYMNFNPNTNPLRKKIYEKLKDRNYISKEMIGNGGDYKNYLMNLKKHKYIISPPGNGIDCHRNWEALYCGCIPIVVDSFFCRNIFSELNVLTLPNYDYLDENVIYEKKDKNSNLNNNSQYKEYWKNKILNQK